MKKNLNQFISQQQGCRFFLYFEYAQTLEATSERFGSVELKSISQGKRLFGNHLMLPCGFEMEKGSRLIQIGDILFRNAMLYVEAEGKCYRLDQSEGYLKFTLSQARYRKLYRQLFKVKPEVKQQDPFAAFNPADMPHINVAELSALLHVPLKAIA